MTKRKRVHPLTKKAPATVQPDGSFRPTWQYRDVDIVGSGRKGFRIKIRSRPTCVTMGEAMDRVDSYHRRRAGQARKNVMRMLKVAMLPMDIGLASEAEIERFVEMGLVRSRAPGQVYSATLGYSIGPVSVHTVIRRAILEACIAASAGESVNYGVTADELIRDLSDAGFEIVPKATVTAAA
ncbi:hypothetical protein SAMN05216360_104210 [Methylobacterium phyllostachyos]|uniref:Uncharacterized protein n=1 Tax=Methylobacterium phyllostachyos TaxID=582672 RepID=A0A1G9X2D2_9HYPH|nr:hypothetical protein [Methylobacterium phyllostachyos]SDM90563.1 hypothetical protein SAMN05216360_104210 [Methylobacterium phyllostachyos]